MIKKVCLAGLALLASTVAHAGDLRPAFMPRGVISEAPFGFTQMCARLPAECEAPKLVPASFTPLDFGTRFQMLRQVNRTVNHAIRFRADKEELWQRPTGAKLRGDCEDYAIEKRSRLIEAGFPATDLFFAVAYVPRVGLHTVLVARMETGDIVLDNRNAWLSNWADSRYIWLLRQSAERPTEWSNLLYKEPVQMAGL